MSRERGEGTRLGWVIAAVLIVVAAVMLLGRAKEAFEPDLVAAWVAVQRLDGDLARVAPLHLDHGDAFTLRAVVEAETRRGETLYYTEAKRLEIGGREVPAGSLRRWDRRARARILWFTVEGFPAFAEFAGPDEELEYKTVFQADWPLTWSVPGDLSPSVENVLPDHENIERRARFGTQRYAVRVETRGLGSEILPLQSLESWGAVSLSHEAFRFPGVVVTIRGPLAELTRVFGLPQREPVGEARAAQNRLVTSWLREGVAFSRLTLVKAWLDSLGFAWEDLRWESADLEGSTPWRMAGEPLRAGERLVWMLEDRGREGILDYDDLCLDFQRGARVLTVREVFIGHGLVERGALPGSNGGDQSFREGNGCRGE
jgi:hypothetical protein